VLQLLPDARCPPSDFPLAPSVPLAPGMWSTAHSRTALVEGRDGRRLTLCCEAATGGCTVPVIGRVAEWRRRSKSASHLVGRVRLRRAADRGGRDAAASGSRGLATHAPAAGRRRAGGVLFDGARITRFGGVGGGDNKKARTWSRINGDRATFADAERRLVAPAHDLAHARVTRS
jgi:hypothetical protein